ncbi:MAG: hypothetical protein M3P85_07565 [Actinomycetota bacterium]|nr:hypothetical protein [Actinomycetota bacterium]
MLSKRTRRELAAMAIAAAATLACSATAFACVVYKGAFTVRQGTTDATNIGANTYMALCSDGGPIAIDRLSSSKVTVETDPFGGDPSCPASQLSAGSYTIRLAGLLVTDCMAEWTLTGASHLVDSSGHGRTELDPLVFAPGDNSVCVINDDLYGGMEMSLVVL